MVPTSKWRRALLRCASAVALLSIAFAKPSQSASLNAADSQRTSTPIKHVIVLIGENRTFDHIFATYVPRSRDSVANLLSKRIINADGTPGPNFDKAAQFQALPPFKSKYFISLRKSEKAPYQTLPSPTAIRWCTPGRPSRRAAPRRSSWRPEIEPRRGAGPPARASRLAAASRRGWRS